MGGMSCHADPAQLREKHPRSFTEKTTAETLLPRLRDQGDRSLLNFNPQRPQSFALRQPRNTRWRQQIRAAEARAAQGASLALPSAAP